MKRGERSSIERAMGRTAALQFHRIAVGLVVPATKVEIARTVGENRQNYSGYLSGRSTITLDHVATWISRWEAAGNAPLVLVVTGCAITVDTVHEGTDEVHEGTDETLATLANEQGSATHPPQAGGLIRERTRGTVRRPRSPRGTRSQRPRFVDGGPGGVAFVATARATTR